MAFHDIHIFVLANAVCGKSGNNLVPNTGYENTYAESPGVGVNNSSGSFTSYGSQPTLRTISLAFANPSTVPKTGRSLLNIRTPLCIIALLNRSLLNGDNRCADTDHLPALAPNIPAFPGAVLSAPYRKPNSHNRAPPCIQNVTGFNGSLCTPDPKQVSICLTSGSFVYFKAPISSTLCDAVVLEINESHRASRDRVIKMPKHPKRLYEMVISGNIAPGQLLAIMGPSGAGKTTLLNALTGRNMGKMSVTGEVLINGRPVNGRTLASISSYIQQNDLFHPLLTVREHLMINATLRLAGTLSHAEKNELVQNILIKYKLNLVNCSESRIGSDMTFKGISGGEMKRLSIASEILTNPSLIDEPTSGLDSFLAESIVRLLKAMACEGRTIVCTIHQPSSQVFALFDHLLLMTDGRVAFMGTNGEVKNFFTSHGYVSVIKATDTSALQVFTYNVHTKLCDKFLDSEYNATLLSDINKTKMDMIFCDEIAIFLREHNNHMYSVSAYYLSHIFIRANTCFDCTFHDFNINYQRLPYSYDILYGCFISSIVPNLQMSMIVMPPMLLIQTLFGGLFLNSGEIQGWLIWLKYLTMSHYGYEALMISQWRTVDYIPCYNNSESVGHCYGNGSNVITSQGFHEDNIHWDSIALIVLAIYSVKCVGRGSEPLPEYNFHNHSRYLHIYGYPLELDYQDIRPLGANYIRFDNYLRAEKHLPFAVPPELAAKPGALVYFSMGTLVSIDAQNMRRLVAILAKSPHRFIVSMGPSHTEYTLANNMWGAASVPQLRVLPLVDLMLTHGGNNTVTETMFFGKPMIVMPRIHDKGFGLRLDAYKCSEEELLAAIDTLLNDKAMSERLAEVLPNNTIG
ncbi:unnamed protein product [Medioppia subpectinata]|uniref:ABC transporter domain-containing protein n=1 Tax=Medioppia subpectinata TaxID=1979941 RepID=A0A7R9PW07_9ACAR|nr:unnamed protein product [Medioppia subpectinata]CAG2102370.1 unnamed protein product [Medioppia subpectinata]